MEINWLAVVVAALSSFVVGFLWYGPLFGKLWQKLVGLTDEQIRSVNLVQTYGSVFVMSVSMSMTLSLLVQTQPFGGGPAAGALLGALISLGIVGMAIGINARFAQRPPMLTLIDSSFNVACLVVMGAIHGAMG